MHSVNLYLLSDYCFCAFIGFILRFVQDRNKKPKPDFLFQFIASIALSYLAYFLYTFYKVMITPPELMIMLLSWLGAFIVATVDNIAKNGIVIYLRKLAEDFLTYTNKHKKQ
jgi:amino acid transporter